MTYQIVLREYFVKKYTKIIKRNKPLQEKINKVILEISNDPTSPKLKTHKILLGKNDFSYSSRVTGDIRIIWDYDKNGCVEIIELLDIGGHSGGNKVYRN